MAQREESDLLGKIQIPEEVLYGVQTQRALQNFPVGNQRSIGSFPSLVEGLLLVKKAAAITNQEIGDLSPAQEDAIIHSVDSLLSQPDPSQFPIHYLHGGGGTSANMNVNEVLANLAEEFLGGHRGEYRLVHPNDHVNLHQSTNDVYPTACHIAILRAFPRLEATLARLVMVLEEKQTEYRQAIHLARTCYQDAVDITYGDFFGGYIGFVSRRIKLLSQAVNALHAVNLGGTIVGRSSDVPPAFMAAIIANLCRVAGDEGYFHPASLFDAAQNADEVVGVSTQLDLLARGLIKIAQDLRVLSSGPEAGLGEIHIPPVQPGSSIMPGKVNPVMPEFLIQACFKVMGNHAACSACLDHGELDLNIWESCMVFNILESMELLDCSLTGFTQKCLQGMQVVSSVNEDHADSIIPRLTRLAHQFGYQRVSDVCKRSVGDLEYLRTLLDKEFPDAS